MDYGIRQIDGFGTVDKVMIQLIKISANLLHPFSKFGCGNHETLSHDAEGHSPRDDLLMFWDAFCRAENAKLFVVDKAPLDALINAVEITFGQTIPNLSAWKEHLL